MTRSNIYFDDEADASDMEDDKIVEEETEEDKRFIDNNPITGSTSPSMYRTLSQKDSNVEVNCDGIYFRINLIILTVSAIYRTWSIDSMISTEPKYWRATQSLCRVLVYR